MQLSPWHMQSRKALTKPAGAENQIRNRGSMSTLMALGLRANHPASMTFQDAGARHVIKDAGADETLA